MFGYRWGAAEGCTEAKGGALVAGAASAPPTARGPAHRAASPHPTPPPLAPPRSLPPSAASFGNSFGATDGGVPSLAGSGASLRDPYAWAQRLRDIPDEDVLAELSMMGYTDAMGNRRGGGGEAGPAVGCRAAWQDRRHGLAGSAQAGPLHVPQIPCAPRLFADKFSFANGTGSSKKNKRRNSVGRAISPRSRRR